MMGECDDCGDHTDLTATHWTSGVREYLCQSCLPPESPAAQRGESA